MLIVFACRPDSHFVVVAGTMPATEPPDSGSPIGKINLGHSINTRYEETKPVLSADGQTLFFARKYCSSNVGGARDPQDIYFSTIDGDGQWSHARHAGAVLNTSGADNLCGIIDKNRFVFFIRNGKKGHFVIRKMHDGTNADSKTGPEVTNESDFLEATFSFEHQVVLFTAKTKNNVAYSPDVDERDIYISRFVNGEWSRPVNLGRRINSVGDEYSPFLSEDGRTLYFATDGRGGFGGVDIFMSRRMGDGWADWSEPQNLGPTINSKAFDAYFTVAPRSHNGFMVSYDRTLGKGDLVSVALAPAFRPLETAFVTLRVLERESMQPLPCRVEIHNGGRDWNGRAYETHKRELQLVFPAETTVSISASAPSRAPVFVSFRATRDTTVTMLLTDESPSFGSILFQQSTIRLLPGETSRLDSVATALTNDAALRIELFGHTDNMGTNDALMRLSERRVNEIRRLLVSKGIDPRRISGKAYGPSRPVTDNAKETHRQKNRRVEIILRRL